MSFSFSHSSSSLVLAFSPNNGNTHALLGPSLRTGTLFPLLLSVGQSQAQLLCNVSLCILQNWCHSQNPYALVRSCRESSFRNKNNCFIRYTLEASFYVVPSLSLAQSKCCWYGHICWKHWLESWKHVVIICCDLCYSSPGNSAVSQVSYSFLESASKNNFNSGDTWRPLLAMSGSHHTHYLAP